MTHPQGPGGPSPGGPAGPGPGRDRKARVAAILAAITPRVEALVAAMPPPSAQQIATVADLFRRSARRRRLDKAA